MEDSQKLQFHLLDGNGKPCGVFDNAILEFIKENYKEMYMKWAEKSDNGFYGE